MLLLLFISCVLYDAIRNALCNFFCHIIIQFVFYHLISYRSFHLSCLLVDFWLSRGFNQTLTFTGVVYLDKHPWVGWSEKCEGWSSEKCESWSKIVETFPVYTLYQFLYCNSRKTYMVTNHLPILPSFGSFLR